jgi:hypothetical protein
MRSSMSKLVSITALALGLAIAAPAFANESTNSNSAGSHNVYNPLEPNAVSNEGPNGPADTYHGSNSVGSTTNPFFSMQPER